jgi:hypothetical protein
VAGDQVLKASNPHDLFSIVKNHISSTLKSPTTKHPKPWTLKHQTPNTKVEHNLVGSVPRPIQVLPGKRRSIMPVYHAVGIQHGDHKNVIFLPQDLGLGRRSRKKFDRACRRRHAAFRFGVFYGSGRPTTFRDQIWGGQ